MTKNITVTDENGKVIGSTYPKRALGLIKKGRAHRINADTICLCARDETEDNKMANNIYDVIDNQMSKIQEQLSGAPSDEHTAAVRIKMLETLENLKAEERKNTVAEVIKAQLDAIQADLPQESAEAREKTQMRMFDIMEMLLASENDKTQKAEEKSAFDKTEQ